MGSLTEVQRRSPRRILRAVAAAVAAHVAASPQICRVLMEIRAQAGFEPAIAAAVRDADARSREQLKRLFAAGAPAGEWPAGTDPALQARLFTAGLYGLMAQWHLEPGSFSLEAAAAALTGAFSTARRNLKDCMIEARPPLPRIAAGYQSRTTVEVIARMLAAYASHHPLVRHNRRWSGKEDITDARSGRPLTRHWRSLGFRSCSLRSLVTPACGCAKTAGR